MEARQRVKLTSTNRPFGLIIKLSHSVFEKVNEAAFASSVRSASRRTCKCQPNLGACMRFACGNAVGRRSFCSGIQHFPQTGALAPEALNFLLAALRPPVLLSPSRRVAPALCRRLTARKKSFEVAARILNVFRPSAFDFRLLQVSGDHTARVPPVPIPNTVVKPRRADDTARATVWERRSSPGLNSKAVLSNQDGLLFL